MYSTKKLWLETDSDMILNYGANENSTTFMTGKFLC